MVEIAGAAQGVAPVSLLHDQKDFIMVARTKAPARATAPAMSKATTAVPAAPVADTVADTLAVATQIDMNDPALSAAEAVAANLKAQG